MIGAFLIWLGIVGFAHSVDQHVKVQTAEQRANEGCHLGIPEDCDKWAELKNEKQEAEENERLKHLVRELR